jgi:GNAT superfamily N-acetyltransferase
MRIVSSNTINHGAILNFLQEIKGIYPNIENWYIKKVVPELHTDQRNIFCSFVDDKLVGLIIAKKEGIEKKICTLRIHPEYRNRGIAKVLMNIALKWLGTDTPHMTISEGLVKQYGGIIRRYNLKLNFTFDGLYKDSVREYFYNYPYMVHHD